MAKSIHPADWADYERARLIEQARKRNQTAEAFSSVETLDEILMRSVWADEEVHARRSIRVLSRVAGAAMFALLAVYGWTITTKAFAIHAADVARAEALK